MERRKEQKDDEWGVRGEVVNSGVVKEEYPSELEVQNTLVRAQVEFYFSDYNLKRDKRLLEKISAEPHKGYLKTEEVLTLSRVRQLVSTAPELYEALNPSPLLKMILPENEVLQREKLKQ